MLWAYSPMVTFYALRCFERRARAHGRRGKGKPVAGAMVMTKKTVPANNERNEDAIVLTSNFLRQAILRIRMFSWMFPRIFFLIFPSTLSEDPPKTLSASPQHPLSDSLRYPPLFSSMFFLHILRWYSSDILLIFFPPISSPNTNDDEECEDPEVHWKARCQSESAPKWQERAHLF